MRHRILLTLSFLCLPVWGICQTPPVAETVEESLPHRDDDIAVATRSRALELAGAFSNDGYKIRDGYVTRLVSDTQPFTLEVNLFAGNEYWFCAASDIQPQRRIEVAIYDRNGAILDQQRYDDGSRFAAGIEPVRSGRYFVQVRVLEGPPTPVTLVYCYK